MLERPSQSRRIAVGAAKLFAGTLASRALGFLRLLLMARYFGGRAAMDVFNIAFLIPNLFRRVLGEQAVESAFLPTFKHLLARDPRQAWRTASAVLNWLILFLLIGAALCYAFAPGLVSSLLAPGFEAGRAAEAAALGRLMSPFLVLIGLAAFCGALLLAHGSLWAYGLAPIAFNVGWIGTMVLSYRTLGIESLGLGVLVGGMLQLLASLVPLWRGRRRGTVQGTYTAAAGLVDAGAFRTLQLALPVCIGGAIARGASVVDRAIASFLEEGSVSALGYAMPLVLLPFALFGLSVGRSAFVALSEQAAAEDLAGFRRSVRTAVRLSLAALVPLSALTVLLAHPLAWLLQGGRFGPAETRMTALALRCYGLGLAGMGLVGVLSRALHATSDTRSPLRAARWALYANVLLSALLALTPLRHGGIALATSASMTLQAGLLFVFLRRRLRALAVQAGSESPR